MEAEREATPEATPGATAKESPEDAPEDALEVTSENAPLSMEDRRGLLQGVLSRRNDAEDGDGRTEECAPSEEDSPDSGLAAVPVAPEPDYSDSEEENRQGQVNCRLPTSADGLIMPRKLANPCLESGDRRQLHRELKFNQKTGRSVLNQKSELQREMERRRDTQQRRQEQLTAETNKNSFERALDERLQRIEPTLKIVDDSQSKCDVTPEFLKVHAKVRANVNTLS